MKTFTIDDIRSWKPCYDPIRYLHKDWSGTCVDILNNESIPFQDRLWCVLRTDLISERTMRLFAVWCYRQTLEFTANPDPRSVKSANVAERFANGQATRKELSAAKSAVAVADLECLATAWSVANSARSAAWSVARSAARSAAESAWSAQRDKLIEMVLEGDRYNAGR